MVPLSAWVLSGLRNRAPDGKIACEKYFKPLPVGKMFIIAAQLSLSLPSLPALEKLVPCPGNLMLTQIAGMFHPGMQNSQAVS